MPQNIDVFVSYKREERDLTEAVLRALRRAGITAVTDRNIAKNDHFGDAIDKMIRQARVTLVLWTRDSAASDWMKEEARLARDLEKAGKPNAYRGVMVEDVSLHLPVDLRSLQMIDLTPEGLTEDGISRIVAELAETLGPEATTTPEAAEAESLAASEDLQLFEYARSLDIASAYALYLKNYPQGRFADDARRELRMHQRWWLHPFHRSRVGHTIALVGIVAAFVIGYWGATTGGTQADGIPQAQHDRVKAQLEDARTLAQTRAQERDTATAQLTDATAANTQLSQDLSAAQTERTRLATALTKAQTDLKDAQAVAAQNADAAERARKAEATAQNLQSRLEGTEASLAEALTKAGKAASLATQLRAEREKLSDDLETAQRDLRAAQTAATQNAAAAERARTAEASVKDLQTRLSATEIALAKARATPKPRPAQAPVLDCDLNGADAYEIAGKRFKPDATRLTLSGTELATLDLVGCLTNLTWLSVSGTQVDNLAPLSGLTNLTTLWVSGTQVDNLAPLSGLTNLTTLWVSGTQVDNLAPLSGLTNLTTLWVSNTLVDNLAPLSGLTNLATLSVSGTQVDNLTPLSGLTNLAWLDVSDTQVDDLAPLSGLTNLTWLWTPEGKITEGREAVIAAIKAGSKWAAP